MISKGRAFLSLFIACILLLPLCSAQAAGDLTLEKQLQQQITRSRELVTTILSRMHAGKPYQSSLTELTGMASGLKTAKDKLSEQFEQQQADISSRGAKAADRHSDMLNSFRDNIDEYLKSLESLNKNGPSISALETLKTLLDRIAPARPDPLYGALPYRHAGFAARKPLTIPAVTPAYRSGSTSVASADRQSTDLAPITLEIATLAQSLGWNPVSIYEWVKNNIKTEWYWGSMKGAVETLRQKSGNDCDQAALLAALLRSAGFPVRYVRGVIEFFPDIESARMQTGLTDVKDIASFFQKAGIAFTQVIAGGKVANFQIEHIWVEAQVPYANYRGTVLDDMGLTWVALDTSIKPAGYTRNQPATDLSALNLSGLCSTYLGSPQTLTPLEYLGQFVAQALPGTTYASLLYNATINPEVLNLLPASLQFKESAITGEYADMPAELVHQVRFTATGSATKQVLFDTTLDVREASNKQIVIAYEPETVEDQEIINSYGGLDNTPGYLVRLRPVLKIDGERMAVAADGLAMGENFTLGITLTAPGASAQVMQNNLITGNLTVLGIAAQQAVTPEPIADDQKTGARILFEQAQNYNQQWNTAEDELAGFLRLALVRPTATIVTLAGVADVTYVLDKPHGFEWKGLYVDAGLRTAETAGGATFTSGSDAVKLFMQLSGLQGSVLEHRLYESAFGVKSISTAKLFGLAAERIIPVITIDKANSANIDTLLPGLDATIRQDIVNAVNQGYTVRIPQAGQAYENWTGTGYIKENPLTGEAGYMLTGMIAGGMTAWTADRWPQYYRDRFENPDSEPPSTDPVTAQSIQKISATDMQQGTVGQTLGHTLDVLVTNKDKKPVAGAEVAFTVKTGSGSFTGNKKSILVTTNEQGIASATYVLGKLTGRCFDASVCDSSANGNAIFAWKAGDKYSQQISEDYIDARLASGTGIKMPFATYAYPDKPFKLLKILGDDISAKVNSPGGSIRVLVLDQYGNPVANQNVVFKAETPPAIYTTCSPDLGCNPPNPVLPAKYRNITFYTLEGCDKQYPLPGECKTSEILTVLSSFYGASVETLMGDTVGTQYKVDASCMSNEKTFTETFTRKTLGARCCTNRFFVPEIYLGALSILNDKGEPVNAAKAGQEVPGALICRMYMLSDNYTLERIDEEKYGHNPYYIVTPTGRTNFKALFDGEIIYTPKSGGSILDKMSTVDGYYAAHYRTTNAPVKNDIEAYGRATIDTPCVLVDAGSNGSNIAFENPPNTRSITLDTGQTHYIELQNGVLKAVVVPEGRSSIVYNVYGVKIETLPEFNICAVDKDGYLTEDARFDYTIQPSDYWAASAYVVVYKDDKEIEYINSETHGTGFITLSAGFKLDLKSKYEIEVVLNKGTQNEILSGRVPVNPPHVELSVDGTVIDPTNTKQYPHIDGTPLMPNLIARFKPEECGGSVQWQLKIEYHNPSEKTRNDKWLSPVKNLTVEQEWKILDDMTSLETAPDGSIITRDLLLGGKATIYWEYVGRSPQQEYVFQIRGNNPKEENVKPYLTSQATYTIGFEPWFLTRLVRQESSYWQFDPRGKPGPEGNAQDTPYWGDPHGWGIMMVEDANAAKPAQLLWDWKFNVDEGLQVLLLKRVLAAKHWVTIMTLYNNWKKNNNNDIIDPPLNEPTYKGISFRWYDVDPLNPPNGAKSYYDAIWIKAYNGNSLGWFLDLIQDNPGDPTSKPHFVFHDTRIRDGKNYVKLVCDENP